MGQRRSIGESFHRHSHIAKMKLLLVAATAVVAALLAADSSDALFLGQGGVFNSKEAQQSFNSRQTDMLSDEVHSRLNKRSPFIIPIPAPPIPKLKPPKKKPKIPLIIPIPIIA